MEKCATCNELVDTETAENRAEYRGSVYYFCCRHCQAAFDQDPERYAEG
jgi:xanthine dehydrogenase accessory factor